MTEQFDLKVFLIRIQTHSVALRLCKPPAKKM